MVRVLICDDHPIFREGLKQTLGVHPDIRVVGEAGSAAELFDVLAGTACDVVVLDISLPDRSGLEVLGELLAAGGPPRAAGGPAKAPARGFTAPAVVLLSMHSEQQYAVRAIRAGASAYIEKASVPQELVQALRKAAAGGVYISPRQAEQLALEVSGRAAGPAHGPLELRLDDEVRYSFEGEREPVDRRHLPGAHPDQAAAAHHGRAHPLRPGPRSADLTDALTAPLRRQPFFFS